MDSVISVIVKTVFVLMLLFDVGKACRTKVFTRAKKYESRSEIEFWATCQNISNLFDGCRHPLLIQIY